MGRPKEKDGELLFDLENGNIFSHLFDEIPDIRVEKCELRLAEHKKENFTCQLCKDIFHVRTVSAGCHYYCASCLSDMFLVNRMNNISCHVCKKMINYKVVRATDQHFRNVLMDLDVMCSVCRYSADYQSLVHRFIVTSFFVSTCWKRNNTWRMPHVCFKVKYQDIFIRSVQVCTKRIVIYYRSFRYRLYSTILWIKWNFNVFSNKTGL